jgi:hypothetical protein
VVAGIVEPEEPEEPEDGGKHTKGDVGGAKPKPGASLCTVG